MISVALHVVTLVCEQLPLLRFLAAMPCAALCCLDQPSFGLTAALECDVVLLQRGPMHDQPDPTTSGSLPISLSEGIPHCSKPELHFPV